jgi:hypothetical protein
VLDRYSNFFLASAGASAAFIGLLFSPDNSALLRLSVVVLLGLYAGGVATAWKITRTT